MIRVVVVDDSALVRSVIAAIINRQSDMECVGVASDPIDARELIRRSDPDVITLDVEMPRMDGLEFLERLMRLRPMPVVMVSTLTERGAEVTLRALSLGAVDFVAKPRSGVVDGLTAMASDIVEKIRGAATARVGRRTITPPLLSDAMRVAKPRNPSLGLRTPSLYVVVGASTGGTEAIKEILIAMPADAPPILITQHMPVGFTASFAARLNSLCEIQVKEAVDGEPIQLGCAYVAPGGKHLRVAIRPDCTHVTAVQDGELVNRHKPSVEVLFLSAAALIGPKTIGVMLTGMGADGAVAMRQMKNAGSYNLVQDEASSVVFGMPREAIAQGAADEVLPLAAIGPAILSRVRRVLAQPVRVGS